MTKIQMKKKQIKKQIKRQPKRQKKTTKKRQLLPTLRKVSYKNKKHPYKLSDPFSKRKLAIHEGVRMEAKKTNKSIIKR